MKNCGHESRQEKRTQRSAWLRQGNACIIIYILVASRASTAKWNLQVHRRVSLGTLASKPEVQPMHDQPVLCRTDLDKEGQRCQQAFAPEIEPHLMKHFWNVCITKSNPVTNEGKIVTSNVKGTTQLFKANVTLRPVYGAGHLNWCKKIVHFNGVTFSFPAREVTCPKTKICNVSWWTVLSQNTIQRASGTQECCRVSHKMKKGKGLSKESQGCQVAREARCILSYQRPACLNKDHSRLS